MDNKNSLILNLSSLLRKDKYIIELLNSAGIQLDALLSNILDTEKQYWFDTMTWGIPIIAKKMDIKFDADATIEDKRASIEAKFKSSGKADIELIQSALDSWKADSTKAEFIDGIIVIEFLNFVPYNLKPIENAINEVKPAHLPYKLIIPYNTWEYIKTFSWGIIKAYTWRDVMNNKEISENLTHEQLQNFTQEELGVFYNG